MCRDLAGSKDFESAAGSKTQRTNKIHGKLPRRNFSPLRDSLMNYFKRGGKKKVFLALCGLISSQNGEIQKQIEIAFCVQPGAPLQSSNWACFTGNVASTYSFGRASFYVCSTSRHTIK